MDSNADDRMIRQIETGLSNNLNDSLFTTGIEKTSLENINDMPPLSRAEYIRHAREACLRQMNTSSYHNRAYDNFDTEGEHTAMDKSYRKRQKGMPILRKGDYGFPAWSGDKLYEENSPEEIASFRALIIRMVCAVVIFLCIFAIDKLDLRIGQFNREIVQEYITGIDALKELEIKFVTWLK